MLKSFHVQPHLHDVLILNSYWKPKMENCLWWW